MCGLGSECLVKRTKHCPTCKQLKKHLCRKELCKAAREVDVPSKIDNAQDILVVKNDSKVLIGPVFQSIGHNGQGYGSFSSQEIVKSLNKNMSKDEIVLINHALSKAHNNTGTLDLSLWWNCNIKKRRREISLEANSFVTLDPSRNGRDKWLDGSVIDFGGDLLNIRERQKQLSIPQYPSKLVITTILAYELHRCVAVQKDVSDIERTLEN
jgi:hypothetical protein